MGAVMKGEKPYNKDEFAALAAQMVDLSKQPWQYFPAGSDKGKTESRPGRKMGHVTEIAVPDCTKT